MMEPVASGHRVIETTPPAQEANKPKSPLLTLRPLRTPRFHPHHHAFHPKNKLIEGKSASIERSNHFIPKESPLAVLLMEQIYYECSEFSKLWYQFEKHCLSLHQQAAGQQNFATKVAARADEKRMRDS